MFRRSLFAASFAILLYFLSGCAGPSKTYINNGSIPNFKDSKILSVTLYNRNVVIFDADGGRYYERYKNRLKVIVGKTAPGQSVVIPLEEVRLARLEDEKPEADAKMLFPTVLIIGLVAAMAN